MNVHKNHVILNQNLEARKKDQPNIGDVCAMSTTVK